MLAIQELFCVQRRKGTIFPQKNSQYVAHRPDREDERARIEGSGGYVAMYWPDGSSYLNKLMF